MGIHAAGIRYVLTLATVGLASAAAAQEATFTPPDSATRRVMVARRATSPIVIDGRLDEAAWRDGAVSGGFSQTQPNFSAQTAYPSEVRILFDDRNLYVGAFNRDSAGMRSIRVQDLRRDFDSKNNDLFGVIMGSTGDRRTSFQFMITPLGSLYDVQAFDGGDASNVNWDALWEGRTTRTDSGWVAEMAIPWTSIRRAPGVGRWDLNFTRNARLAYQWTAWAPYPRQLGPSRLTYAGVLDSIVPPPPGMNLRVRPYLVGEAPDLPGAAGPASATGWNAGGELIWSPTDNSVVEGTWRTDFAQADADRQVVNLTRFSVFFPERRQFFLENSDLLSGGGVTGTLAVQPFFSRRIGLADNGTPIPIDGGVRYAYRSGTATLGALAMHQQATASGAATTFGVLRGSRTFGRRNRVGTMLALRSDAGDSPTTNVVSSADVLLRPTEQVQVKAMVSTSTEDGTTSLASTYFFGRTTPTLYTGFLGAVVGRGYNPRTGFVSRNDVMLTSPAVIGTIQPGWLPKGIVWLKPALVTYFYTTPGTGTLQEGFIQTYVDVQHRDGALWWPGIERHFQRPTAAFNLLPGVTIPAGTHDYWREILYVSTDQSAVLSGSAHLSTGTFFDGRSDAASGSIRWAPGPRFSIATSFDVNHLTSIGTRDTTLTTWLVGPEVRIAPNPRLQATAFYQHNASTQRGSLNARVSWEYLPLSYLHIVYTERRALDDGPFVPEGRLIVKLSLLRQL